MNQEDYYANIGQNWVWPVDSSVPVARRFRTSSSYGYRDESQTWHSGHDIGNAGNCVFVNGRRQGVAVARGRLGPSREEGARGWLVDLTTESGTFNNRNTMLLVRYQHLHPTGISQNRPVVAGERIARMGETGMTIDPNASNVHLHWEVQAVGDALGSGTPPFGHLITTNPLQFFRHYHYRIRAYNQTS
jgi:murein DD-endopeptidase MepM/ murein hydrolase activator NlpD